MVWADVGRWSASDLDELHPMFVMSVDSGQLLATSIHPVLVETVWNSLLTLDTGTGSYLDTVRSLDFVKFGLIWSDNISIEWDCQIFEEIRL